jgi:para-aminobenzoate synthetase component 1
MSSVPPSVPAVSARRLTLTSSVEEMALRLRGLPGFVWLDTAGHAQQPGEGLSVLAARPSLEYRGHISDVSLLRESLRQHAVRASVDLGLPLGGLIGTVDYEGAYHFGCYENLLVHRPSTEEWWEVGDLLCHAQDVPWLPPAPKLNFQTQMPPTSFMERVRQAQDYIAAGDIYQVNLTHQMVSPWPLGTDALGTYLRLRDISPAPYAAFLDQGYRQVLSSSPESFLKMTGDMIQTRPIKGTRPRFRDEAADQKSLLDLLASEKERAELLMITDLQRNDLGQVCAFGSVHVPELLKLERYAHVFHLVSTVQGTLRAEEDHLSALQACFPGGSITGAPKRRAREIITELETTSRGLYTGCIGYLGFDGGSHFNIAIRTLVVEGNQAHFHVGAGIVADSIPEREWEETLHKAQGLLSL